MPPVSLIPVPVHRSHWKFIFPIGHISFGIRQDSMLKLIRNYINPIRFAVWEVKLLYRFQLAPYLGAAAAIIVAEDLILVKRLAEVT